MQDRRFDLRGDFERAFGGGWCHIQQTMRWKCVISTLVEKREKLAKSRKRFCARCLVLSIDKSIIDTLLYGIPNFQAELTSPDLCRGRSNTRYLAGGIFYPHVNIDQFGSGKKLKLFLSSRGDREGSLPSFFNDVIFPIWLIPKRPNFLSITPHP